MWSLYFISWKKEFLEVDESLLHCFKNYQSSLIINRKIAMTDHGWESLLAIFFKTKNLKIEMYQSYLIENFQTYILKVKVI